MHIREGAAVDDMMNAIWREAPPDVLVNNAAATFIAQSEHLSFRAADAILAPTLHGAMYCTLAAGKRWIDGEHNGVVLSTLSTSTITGRAFTVPSAMAKSAVLAMTKSLAVEWGFLVSDRAGYINGEMVVIDGGAHLRSSGVEDLLRWTDAQWADQRAARTKS